LPRHSPAKAAFHLQRDSRFLFDRVTEQRRGGGQHAPEDPKQHILPVGSQNAAKPSADKTADLVEHKGRAQQQANLLDTVWEKRALQQFVRIIETSGLVH